MSKETTIIKGNKDTHSQDEMLNAITLGCKSAVQRMMDMESIHEDGMTSIIGEVGFSGNEYYMSVVLTKKDDMDVYIKHNREKVIL